MKRNNRINFWLSENDFAELSRQAAEAGLSRSDFIRKRIAEAGILPTPDVDYNAYSAEFKRLGNTLNDYTAEYNATGFLDAEGVETVWSEIKALTERLRDELIAKTEKLKVKKLNGEK